VHISLPGCDAHVNNVYRTQPSDGSKRLVIPQECRPVKRVISRGVGRIPTTMRVANLAAMGGEESVVERSRAMGPGPLLLRKRRADQPFSPPLTLLQD